MQASLRLRWIVGSLIALVLIGLLLGYVAVHTGGRSERSSAPSALPTNSSGLTYGAQRDSGEEPDLILVGADNGKTGYVYRKALDHATGGDVASPAEAVEWTRKVEAPGWEPPVLPVFRSDGRTRIGSFRIDRGAMGAE